MLSLSTYSDKKNVSMERTEPYHRENLRQTLLEAAVALIGEVGPRDFTLREVARRAGVSHNAPYRHFPAKDDLLVAVATEGFDRLTAGMQRSSARGKTGLERLQLCGCGYVDFALRWPHHFLVMFDLPKTAREGCKDEPAGKDAFEVLMGCIMAAQEAGDLPAGDPLPQALTAWSLVHGIAKLAVSGNLPLSHRATLNFTRRATKVLSDGLMNAKAG
jgi:AcrR family transcriptional regulator